MTLKRARTGNDEELTTKLPHNQRKIVSNSGPNSSFQLQQSPPPAHRTAPVVNQVKIGEFLKYCYYCKKKISTEAEIFMYRDFCAFCSVECREIQISLDKTSRNRDKKEVL